MSIDPRTISKVGSAVIKKLADSVKAIIKAWFRFFWGLNPGGKIAATVVEIILLVIIAPNLHLNPNDQHTLVVVGAFGFMFLLIFSILFGNTRKK